MKIALRSVIHGSLPVGVTSVSAVRHQPCDPARGGVADDRIWSGESQVAPEIAALYLAL